MRCCRRGNPERAGILPNRQNLPRRSERPGPLFPRRTPHSPGLVGPMAAEKRPLRAPRSLWIKCRPQSFPPRPISDRPAGRRRRKARSPPDGRRLPVAATARLQRRPRRPAVLGEDLGGDREYLARLDEIAVLDVLGRAEDDDRVGEVLSEPDRPRRGLGHRLEHQHPRHDGKAREMIREILLRERQRFDRRDALAGVDGGHSVEQGETHESSMASEVDAALSPRQACPCRRSQYRDSPPPHNSRPAPRATTFSGLPS